MNNSIVYKAVVDSIRISVRDSVGCAAWYSIMEFLQNYVGISVRNSVRDSVAGSVGDSVWRSVNESIGDYFQ